MSTLLRKAALGQKVTRFDKIKTLASIEGVEGFAWGARVSDDPLTMAEENTLALRRAEILKAKRGAA